MFFNIFNICNLSLLIQFYKYSTPITYIRDEMSALCADLITRGDLNNNDLCRNVAGLWHPVDNAVLLWRPREIPVREEKAAKKGAHFEEVRAWTQMYAAQQLP